MNGVFKKPENSGRGTRLINVFDLYSDTTVDLESVDRLELSPQDIEKYRVSAGDIFFTRSSLKPEGVAWSAYLEDDIEEEAVFECHIVRARVDRNHAVPGFVSNYARSTIGRAYLIARANLTTMATIDQLGISELPVVLPKPPKQKELLSALDAARGRRKKMLAGADALLASLDGFVLDQLGLTLSPPESHRTTYAVRLRDVTVERKLYPDYFHPERINAIKMVQANYPGDRSAILSSIADFRRDQRQVQPGDAYLGLASVQPNTGERVESTDEDGEGTVFEYVENDVLFARLRPYLNKVYRADSGGVCSPEFHVMRIYPGIDGKPRINPDYLAAVLRSRVVLAQTKHMMTGNTHPRLANDDVVNLVVPIPDSKVQMKIAAEVARRGTEARRLREEAKALWEKAKADFEDALLSPAK